MTLRGDIARQLIISMGDGKPGSFATVLKRLDPYDPTKLYEWWVGPGPSRTLVRLYQLADVPPESLLTAVNRMPGVRAERNVELRPAATAADPLYAEQWALTQMSAEAAWACLAAAMPLPPVTVAVVDSGIAAAHPDLVTRISPASARFIAELPDTFIEDEDGHGTYLSGTIAAVTNNGVGIASAGGPATVNIMALKFYDPWNLLDAANAARAISYAVENGAHVINASWHVGMASQVLFDAIQYAASQEVVFVAAAGNEGLDNDQLPTWPASYTALPNVISVMASNRHDEKPGFSNYGDTTVHLAAPGVGVLSTQSYLIGPPRYRNYGGTSAAAAHVAAAAALVKALAPAMTAAAIRAHLIVTADRRRFLRCVARGRLNLAQAVCALA